MVGPLPTGILGHDPNLDVPRMDLAKAKEFMAKTDKPEGGFTLKMVYVTGLEQERRFALVMLDSLKALNIGLDIQPMAWPDMVASCAKPGNLPRLLPGLPDRQLRRSRQHRLRRLPFRRATAAGRTRSTTTRRSTS